MRLDYMEDGFVNIDMQKYVKDILDEVPDEMSGQSTTPPARTHLFDMDENKPSRLLETKSQFFHYVTARLLLLCKRARPDIQTAISFLCTLVRQPDEDDYKKLCRMMKYLDLTKTMVLQLSSDNPLVIKWWADASLAVHRDMKSHTGGVMSFGRMGAVYSTSTKQKLNTCSSTKAESVGVDDVLPQMLWTQYFLKGQGYHVDPAKGYQDNHSAILLEGNGTVSSSKQTRHSNIRYYFVTNCISCNEMTVKYCPTEEMIADFFPSLYRGPHSTNLENSLCCWGCVTDAQRHCHRSV